MGDSARVEEKQMFDWWFFGEAPNSNVHRRSSPSPLRIDPTVANVSLLRLWGLSVKRRLIQINRWSD